MSKKYESANVSEVEDHISLKYEIKKRLGKGVSDCLSLEFLLGSIKFDVNSKAVGLTLEQISFMHLFT